MLAVPLTDVKVVPSRMSRSALQLMHVCVLEAPYRRATYISGTTRPKLREGPKVSGVEAADGSARSKSVGISTTNFTAGAAVDAADCAMESKASMTGDIMVPDATCFAFRECIYILE